MSFKKAIIFNVTATGKDPKLPDQMLKKANSPNITELLQEYGYDHCYSEETTSTYKIPTMFPDLIQTIDKPTDLLLIGSSSGAAEMINFLQWCGQMEKSQFTTKSQPIHFQNYWRKIELIDIIFLSPCFVHKNLAFWAKITYLFRPICIRLCHALANNKTIIKKLGIKVFTESMGQTQFKNDPKFEEDFLFEYTKNLMNTSPKIIGEKLNSINKTSNEALPLMKKIRNIQMFIGNNDNTVIFEEVDESFKSIFANYNKKNIATIPGEDHVTFVENSSKWIPPIQEKFFEKVGS